MANKSGYLTIYSPDQTLIYGEFADAYWAKESSAEGTNNIFTGTASEGTLETFLQLDKDAISHVAFTFESNGQTYAGPAELMAPVVHDSHGKAVIKIETGAPLERD